MHKKYFFLIAFLLLHLFGYGQTGGKDTLIGGTEIEIIQSYKPQLRQLKKPEYVPQVLPADTGRRNFVYVVPQQPLFYSYHSDPFKPLVLGKDTILTTLPNYARFAIGNLYSVYIDAGYSSLKTTDYETYFHVHHISQYGNIKYQQTALSGIESEGMWHQNNNEWRGRLNVERNQYYYYGFDHSLYQSENQDSLKQTFTTIKAIADYKRKEIGDSKFDYQPSVNIGFYGARFKTHETSFGFNIPLTYEIDTSINLHLNILTNFAQLKTDSPSVSNNLFKITPGADFSVWKITGHGNLGIAVGKNNNVSVLPDIEGIYLLPNTDYKFSGGWYADIRQNTYEQLTTDNPYIVNHYAINQTRTDEVFINFSSFISQLQYNGRISWYNFNSLPTYVNTTGDQKQFNILYDTVSAFSIQASANYIMANKYTIGIGGKYYAFYGGTFKYPWHIPNLRVNSFFAMKPIPKLTVTANLLVLSGMNAIDGTDIINLKPIVDVGVYGEYVINWRFNVFLQGNNLLNNTNRQWFGYDLYGINILAGLRAKF